MTGFGFPGRYKLKKTDEFSSVFNFRKRISGTMLAIYSMPNILGHARLGLVVAKKTTPNAVQRNYMKRVLRELFRQEHSRLWGVDLVVRPQKTFSESDFPAVRSEFQRVVDRLCKQSSGTQAS